ncbi:MAG: hypothetical protein WA741_18005, partial [Candidatus Sulfotelmatobacter sp.]
MLRIYAIVTAILTWLGLALQCYLTVTLSISIGKTLVAGLISFFSYFTILTNLLAAVVLSCSARAPKPVWVPSSRVSRCSPGLPCTLRSLESFTHCC